MNLIYEYKTCVCFSPSIGRHNVLLRCLPAREAFQQSVEEEFELSEGFWYDESRDGQGNRILHAGTTERHDRLVYQCRGRVLLSTYCIPDASPHPMYRLPSALTLGELPPSPAPAVPSSGSAAGVSSSCSAADNSFLPRVIELMHFTHQYLSYLPGSTNCNTPLSQVLHQRCGVCQDFAHMLIALCRRHGFHARYVCGLMQGEGQTHAWVEVHDGQCWYAFDPTNDTAIATGYIKLAHGRDALDCPVSRGTYLGVTQEATEVSVVVTPQNNTI